MNIPFWIFDTKGEYADILPAIRTDVLAIRFRDFRRNPFEGPPNLSQDEWLEHLVNYLGEALFYWVGIINEFRETCKRVLAKNLGLNARTFAEEFQKVRLKSRRGQDYLESLKRFINTLELPPYQCATGFDLTELSRRSVVFNLDNVADDHRLFFAADLLTWLAASRGYERNRRLEMVVVLDELSRFYSKDSVNRRDIGEPVILDILKRARYKGIGVILADQTYTQFHEVIRSNCQTKVVFETPDSPCRLQVARDLGLDSEQQLFLRELAFGEPSRRVLVQLATYPRPFLMTLPNWQKPTEPTIYSPPALPWTPLPEEKPAERKERNRDRVTHEMDRYLGIVANNPFLMETEYDEIIRKKFGAHSRRKGTRIRQDLKDAGFLEEHPINLYRPGKQIKIAMPTKAGYEYLDRRAITYRVPGNGGIEHKFWQHTIAKGLQKHGWTADIEGSLRGKQVDVGAVKEHGLMTERVAYEVVWEDLQKEVSNLEKDVADGWDRVIFCVRYRRNPRAASQSAGPVNPRGRRPHRDQAVQRVPVVFSLLL